MRRVLLPSLLLLTFLASAAVHAEEGQPSIPCERFTLPNGLEVIFHEDHRLPLACTDIWYHVGSKDERPGRDGFAHLFEHLMFMGTERVPRGKFDEILEAGGAWSNASTDFDYTDYYDVGPAHMLSTFLWLEADRMDGLGKAMTQEKLDLQKEVVRNEIRESYDNAPYGPAELRIYKEMYPPGHPYDHDPIGSHQDVAAATVSDVKHFFSTYYVPNNATLVVAGDFDPKATRAQIEREFGAIPRADDPPKPFVPPVGLTSVRHVTMPDDVELPRVIFLWHSPPKYRPGDAAMESIASLLADGKIGRLHQRLVHDDRTAVDVSAWQDADALGGMFRIEVTVAPGVGVERIEKSVEEELEKLEKEGPTDEELVRVRASIERSTVTELQSLLGQADRLARYDTYVGEPDRLAWDLDRYRHLTKDEVHAAAQKWLPLDRRLVLRVVPRTASDPAEALAQRPPERPAQAFVPPTPQVFQLENGLDVWLLDRPGLPLVSGEIVLPVGSASDDRKAAGRAYLSARMLLEGAGDLDAAAFDAARERLGASISVDADRDATTLDFAALRENAEQTLRLVALALTRPRFDPNDWDRLRTRHLNQIRQIADDPDTLADRAGIAALYPSPDPYGAPVSGTIESISALTLEDVRSFHAVHHGPAGAHLLLVGDLGRDDAQAIVRRAFGSWNAAGTNGPGAPTPSTVGAPPSPPQPAGRLVAPRVVLVDREGAAQTVVRLFLPAPPWKDTRDRLLETANEILGGSFTSRLNQTLREKMGATYGVSSNLRTLAGPGWIRVYTSIDSSATKDALATLLEVVRDFGKGNATDAEIARAVSTLRSNLVQWFESQDYTLGTYFGYALHGDSPEGLAKDTAALSQVTTAKVNDAARRWFGLGMGAPVLVLVGDPKAMHQALEGLGLPPPVEMKAQEVLR